MTPDKDIVLVFSVPPFARPTMPPRGPTLPPRVPYTPAQIDLIKDLSGNICRACGKRKGTGMSFCGGRAMGKALYSKVGKGYEEAFEAAMKKLVPNGASGMLLGDRAGGSSCSA